MVHRGIYAYPWDLLQPAAAAGGLGNWLSGLGLDTLVLAASYHAGRFLRPSSCEAKDCFPEDGTVYFRPDLARYGHLKPQVAAFAAERDPFLALEGVRTEAWVVLLHNARLGQLHPECAARNAFGETHPYSLCPAHPESRFFAVTLCRDLADRYPLAGLNLETPGWLTFPHGWHHEFRMVEPNPWLEALLGLCFCDSCLQGARLAGLNAEGLRDRVKQAINAYLQGPAVAPRDMALGWLACDLLQDGELSAFLSWRCHKVTTLVAEIRAAVRRDVGVRVIATCQRPHATAFLEGHDLKGLNHACDGLDLPLYQPDAAAVEADLWDVLRRLGGGPAPRVILRPGPPDMASEAQLRDTLGRIRALGIGDLAFYHAGHLRPRNLAWIPGAMREVSWPSN